MYPNESHLVRLDRRQFLPVSTAEEKVSVYKALQATTINAACVLRLEDLTGSIAVGKKADFVLLAENPMKVDPLKIKGIVIHGTVFESKPYPINACLLCDPADNAGLAAGLVAISAVGGSTD